MRKYLQVQINPLTLFYQTELTGRVKNKVMATTSELKSKFYAAIEQSQAGQLSATDTVLVVKHLYECVQEVSDAVPSYEESGDMTPKSNAHLDRFEMYSTLRQFGINVSY